MKALLLVAIILNLLHGVAPLSLYTPRSKRRVSHAKSITPLPRELPQPAAQEEDESYVPRGNGIMASATAATLKTLASFVAVDDSKQSDTAAKIEINSVPPTSIHLDLTDIPIVGGMLSGTWAKVGPLKSKPSVKVGSPKDKIGAIRKFLDHGRLEFDIAGMLTTHLDVDVEPNKRGQASVMFRSALIPKWPFGRARSDWNRVTNMGTGETYYFNNVSGEAQYEEPEELR